ncbi:MAG: YqgE/AlgH family protein [Ilumatobacteraceae bacterium]
MNDNAIIFPQPGAILLAHPLMEDPNFARTAVLLIAHDNDEGSMGVVLNRPDIDGDIDPDSPLQRWIHSAAPPYQVFIGGPVELSNFLCLQEDITTTSGVTSIDILSDNPRHGFRHRVFRGYAGWGPGQLQHEIKMGGWIVVASEQDDVFDNDSEYLWSRILARQVSDVRKLSLFPDDPTLN